MKKILAIIACLAICLSMAACNSSKKDDGNNSSAEVSSESDSAKLEAYVDSVKDTLEALSTDEIEVKVTTRGNSMVLTYTYKQELTNLDTVKTLLDEQMEGEAMTSSFEASFKELKKAVPNAESIIVEYVAVDGTLITSKEYK